MAKFVFTLAGMLGIKEKLEEQKKLEFGQAVSQLEAEKQKKEQMEEDKTSYISRFKKSLTEKISPKDIQGYNDNIELLKRRIKEQGYVISKAETFVEQKRLEMTEAMKERKMMETLRDKQYEEYQYEEKLAEQKLVDERVSYTFGKVES